MKFKRQKLAKQRRINQIQITEHKYDFNYREFSYSIFKIEILRKPQKFCPRNPEILTRKILPPSKTPKLRLRKSVSPTLKKLIPKGLGSGFVHPDLNLNLAKKTLQIQKIGLRWKMFFFENFLANPSYLSTSAGVSWILEKSALRNFEK